MIFRMVRNRLILCALSPLVLLGTMVPVPCPAAEAGEGRSADSETEFFRPRLAEPSVTGDESKVLQSAEERRAADPQAAIDGLRDALTEESSAAVPFALARLLLAENRRDAAKEAFRDALRRMPTFARARRNLALLHLEDGEYRSAAGHLRVLLADPASDAGETWKMLAYTYLLADKARAAANAYRTALALRPDDPEVRQGLIQAQIKMDEVGNARSLIREELERAPDQRDLWMLLASDDLAKGRSFEALVWLDCIRRLGMADASSLVTEGNLLLERGVPAEAGRRFLEAANSADVAAGDLVAGARGLLAFDQADDARELVQAIRRQTDETELSDDDQARLGLVRVALAERTEGEETALELCESLLGQFPMNGPLLLRGARLHQQHGQLEQARLLYERAGRLENSSIRRRSLVRRAQIAVERGRYRQAEAYLVKALKIEHADYIRNYLDQLRALSD